eukprot:2852544-Pleurochrysis_carterae.AAC.3
MTGRCFEESEEAFVGPGASSPDAQDSPPLDLNGMSRLAQAALSRDKFDCALVRQNGIRSHSRGAMARVLMRFAACGSART